MKTLSRLFLSAVLLMPFGFAFADSPSLSISSLSPGQSVNAATQVSFSVTPSGFGGTPTYTVSDSFSGSTVTSDNMKSWGVFAWVPSASDAGSHTITVTASDGLGGVAVAYEVITVIGPPTVTIQSISPGSSVNPGITLTFHVNTSGFTNPTFAIFDSFNASTLTSSAIDSVGGFAWTPTGSDAGTHTITVTAVDSYGHSANASVQATVNQPASISIGSLLPAGGNAVATSPVTFSVIPNGFASTPVYTVSDSYSGSSVTNANLSASGQFSWTPFASEAGTHTITVTANPGTITQTTASVSVNVSVPGSTTTPTSSPVVIASAKPTLTTSQIQSILSLIQSFGADAATVANVSAVLNGQTPSTPTGTAVSAGDGYKFTAYLALGSTGTAVTELQKRLAVEGVFTGAATGYYGALTQKAVMAYQAKHGIQQLGVVGPSTRASLNGS